MAERQLPKLNVAGSIPVSRSNVFSRLHQGLRLHAVACGTPREPVHIHVEKDDLEAKFWLIPEVRVAYNDGYDARTLRELLEIVETNKDRIERAWNEFFR